MRSRNLPVGLTCDCPEMNAPKQKVHKKLFFSLSLFSSSANCCSVQTCCFVYNVRRKADVWGNFIKPWGCAARPTFPPPLSLLGNSSCGIDAAACLFPAVARWGSWWQRLMGETLEKITPPQSTFNLPWQITSVTKLHVRLHCGFRGSSISCKTLLKTFLSFGPISYGVWWLFFFTWLRTKQLSWKWDVWLLCAWSLCHPDVTHLIVYFHG